MKTCNVDGCNKPVWGKGLCRMHGPQKPLKRSTLRVDPKERRRIEENALQCLRNSRVISRNDFFNSIWAKRPHVCQHCGKPLGSEPLSYMFDHLLEKSKYPEFEYEEDNILLVCLECHDCKTRGIISDKYQEKINFVITKFNVS